MIVVFTVLTVIAGGALLFLRKIEQTVMDAYRAWGTGEMLVEYMESNSGQWHPEIGRMCENSWTSTLRNMQA